MIVNDIQSVLAIAEALLKNGYEVIVTPRNKPWPSDWRKWYEIGFSKEEVV